MIDCGTLKSFVLSKMNKLCKSFSIMVFIKLTYGLFEVTNQRSTRKTFLLPYHKSEKAFKDTKENF